MLEHQLRAMGLLDKSQTYTRFEEVFRQMWINNGNEVSKIYAGTGAIQGGSKVTSSTFCPFSSLLCRF